MSYYVYSHNKSKLGIKDTKDGVVEYYTPDELTKFFELGVEIEGTHLTDDNKVSVVEPLGEIIEQSSKPKTEKPLPEKSSEIDMKEVSKKAFLEGYVIIIFDENDNFESIGVKVEEHSQRNEKVIVINNSNVSDMSELFLDFTGDVLDLSYFDTSKVTNMAEMFQDLDVNELILGNWDTSNVVDMRAMFENVEMDNLNVENWDVANVKDMTNMFYNVICNSLDLSKWNVSNVRCMHGMFENICVDDLRLDNWDVRNVTSMCGMFKSAYIPRISLQGWETDKLRDTSYMFYCVTFENTSLDFSKWHTENVTCMVCMFEGFEIDTLDLTSFSVCHESGFCHLTDSNYKTTQYIFKDCKIKQLLISDKKLIKGDACEYSDIKRIRVKRS